MGAKALGNQTYEEYLKLESSSEVKYEFHDGFITAMAGGTLAHGQISGNTLRAIGNSLDSALKSCIVYTADVKIHIESSRRTFYPDLSIVCGEPCTSDKDPHALLNPLLVVEVLSESTEAFDRGAKFSHYRRIPSLKEYVLVSQSEPFVDTYFRRESGFWEIQSHEGWEAEVPLQSIACKISMKEIYRLVKDIDPSTV